jgi:hypothetical protein
VKRKEFLDAVANWILWFTAGVVLLSCSLIIVVLMLEGLTGNWKVWFTLSAIPVACVIGWAAERTANK